MLRTKGFAGVSQVEYAIVEQNGQLSVVLRAEKSPLTPSDEGEKPVERGMAHALIVDGKISPAALAFCGKDETWVKQVCRKHKTAVSDVFLLTVDDSEHISIIKKERK